MIWKVNSDPGFPLRRLPEGVDRVGRRHVVRGGLAGAQAQRVVAVGQGPAAGAVRRLRLRRRQAAAVVAPGVGDGIARVLGDDGGQARRAATCSR